MDVLVRVLLLALFCLLPHKTSLVAAKEYKYVNEGDTITLRCSTENVSLASWYGPSQTTRTLSQYFNGQSRSQAHIKSVSIQVYTDAANGYETYNLVISNISTEMGGDYRCQRSQHNSEETLFYTVVFTDNSSVVKIDVNGQINGEKLYWRENILITVTCSTEQDISVMNISWYKHGSRVKSGESNTLTWSFVPTRTDNNRTITCEVYITQQKRPLVKTLILDIEYDPVVIFETIPKELIEGNSFEISCDVDGHPPLGLVHIKKGNNSLTSCNGSSCSYRLNGTRQDSGIYTCHVFSNLTKHESTSITTVNVLYPPDVTVCHHGNTLYCKAKGNPNNISFVAWQHYSEFGNIIMSVKGSELLDININKRYATNGIYTCDATNGIPDMSGNIVKSGEYSLQVNGRPEILPVTQMIQYGKYREPLEVTLYVYSVPPITTARVYKLNTNVMETMGVTWVNRNITIISFEKQVVLESYEIIIHIHSLINADIGNYTFVIGNKIGKTNCTILVRDEGEISDGKNTSTIEYFIGISVGSSIFGALVSLCIYYCCAKISKSSNLNIVLTNINSAIEVQYDEIDVDNLQGMDEISVNLRRQDNNRPTNPEIEGETENTNVIMATTYTNVATKDQHNEIEDDTIHEIDDIRVRRRSQDINRLTNAEIEAQTEEANIIVTYTNNVVEENEAGLDIILGDSNSDDSSDKSSNSYINVPQSTGNQYQSLVGCRSGDKENSYDELHAGNRLETHYYNLRI